MVLPKGWKFMLYLSRGVMVLGLIVLMNTGFTGPVIETATDIDLLGNTVFGSHGRTIGLLAGLQHIVILLVTWIAAGHRQRKKWWYPVGDAVLLVLLFSIADPVISFSVYFALWHSLGHLKELQAYFRDMGRELTVFSFY
ncbi:MAG: Brp/Blh family beta-carotene 15,15'-dioxygenase, partial [Balneolaceae bacterium]|nr:Brp/Blh family beta-carotene 15,15'-dioxygenase [Balneolaceae bacterium]